MTPTWLNHLRQAQQCLTRKEWDAAAQLSRKALASKPDCALAQQILGLIAFENGRVDEAMAHLSGALSIRPDLVPAHNTLGRCYLLMGRLEEAEACFNRVLFLQPGHPYAHFSRAAIWLKRGAKSYYNACSMGKTADAWNSRIRTMPGFRAGFMTSKLPGP